ncbi:hypothetical protein C8J57DRAFT_1464573 [Mycena rebaudengoi]|nr:hypothetical protein C8J57DRAFT_1464573 [Mycena rebaudengoi]
MSIVTDLFLIARIPLFVLLLLLPLICSLVVAHRLRHANIVLEQEVAFQQGEILQLEARAQRYRKLVDEKPETAYIAELEEESVALAKEIRRLNVVLRSEKLCATEAANHHALRVAHLNDEIARWATALRDAHSQELSLKGQKVALKGQIVSLQARASRAEEESASLSVKIQQKATFIQGLTEQYNAQCQATEIIRNMHWALEQEVNELKGAIQDLKSAEQQKITREVNQTAVIEKLHAHIKTSARTREAQDTQIKILTMRLGMEHDTERRERQEYQDRETVCENRERACQERERACEKWESANWRRVEEQQVAVTAEDQEMNAVIFEEMHKHAEGMLDLASDDDLKGDIGEELDMSTCSVIQSAPMVAEDSVDETQRVVPLISSAPPSATSAPGATSRTIAPLPARKLAHVFAQANESPLPFSTNGYRVHDSSGNVPVLVLAGESQPTRERSVKRVKVDGRPGKENCVRVG